MPLRGFRPYRRIAPLVAACAVFALPILATASTTIEPDPKGFQEIAWGTALKEQPRFVVAQSFDHVIGYDLKDAPLALGEAALQSIRYFTIDGQFGRVTVKYVGKENHAKMLAYLQAQYGPIDRTPGSMMRGLNQQFNWRGNETEVNLTYEAKGERGFLSIESRVLSPRFNEFLSDTGPGY